MQIKSVRQSVSKTQKEFGESLGVSRDTLASYESGRVVPSNTFVQLLCSTYSVSEDWLRTGNGEMLVETGESTIENLADEYQLGAFEKEILKIYLEFPNEQRETLKEFAFSLVDTVLNNDFLYREYRKNYIGKNAQPFAARHGDTANMEELVEDFDNATSENDNDPGD